MVHGFNGSNGASGGTEELAFIPSAAMQHIAELANQVWASLLRGWPTDVVRRLLRDAWNTVLVGTTGGGGSSKAPNATSVGNGSVFALNVSDPTAFGASSVLWVSGKTESDLGSCWASRLWWR